MARKRTGISKLSDGFFITASDLYRAVHSGNFLGSELALIGQAHEMGWAPGLLDGSREPRPFRINLTAMARESVFHRDTLRAAHRRLEMYRVFLPHELEDGTYWINKDYRQWLNSDGEPRFDRAQLARIAAPGPLSLRGPIITHPRAAARGSGPADRSVGADPCTYGPLRRCVTDYQTTQPDAPSPLDGAGTESASARANSDLKKKKIKTPLPPRGGEEEGSPPGTQDGGRETGRRKGRGRRASSGPDWDALTDFETDMEV